MFFFVALFGVKQWIIFIREVKKTRLRLSTSSVFLCYASTLNANAMLILGGILFLLYKWTITKYKMS